MVGVEIHVQPEVLALSMGFLFPKGCMPAFGLFDSPLFRAGFVARQASVHRMRLNLPSTFFVSREECHRYGFAPKAGVPPFWVHPVSGKVEQKETGEAAFDFWNLSQLSNPQLFLPVRDMQFDGLTKQQRVACGLALCRPPDDHYGFRFWQLPRLVNQACKATGFPVQMWLTEVQALHLGLVPTADAQALRVPLLQGNMRFDGGKPSQSDPKDSCAPFSRVLHLSKREILAGYVNLDDDVVLYNVSQLAPFEASSAVHYTELGTCLPRVLWPVLERFFASYSSKSGTRRAWVPMQQVPTRQTHYDISEGYANRAAKIPVQHRVCVASGDSIDGADDIQLVHHSIADQYWEKISHPFVPSRLLRKRFITKIEELARATALSERYSDAVTWLRTDQLNDAGVFPRSSEEPWTVCVRLNAKDNVRFELFHWDQLEIFDPTKHIPLALSGVSGTPLCARWPWSINAAIEKHRKQLDLPTDTQWILSSDLDRGLANARLTAKPLSMTLPSSCRVLGSATRQKRLIQRVFLYEPKDILAHRRPWMSGPSPTTVEAPVAFTSEKAVSYEQ